MPEDPPIIDQQSEQYRRGQVLGFTMAEIMLVLLFLLLILLGNEITQLTRDLKAYISPQSPQGSSALLISDTLQQLKSQGQVPESEDELSLTEKLVLRAADTVNDVGVDEEVEEKIARLTKERDQLRARNQELGQENQSLQRELEKDPEELERQRMGEDLLAQANENRVSFERAMMCMDDCGGGDGKEACWGESIFNPDYVYTLALYDERVWVQPVEAAIDKHRQDWDAMPDAARIERPQYLSNPEYRRRFSALASYADSKEKGPKGCVFHVRVFDLGTTSKESYKAQERMVQRYTYRTSIENNDKWEWELPPVVRPVSGQIEQLNTDSRVPGGLVAITPEPERAEAVQDATGAPANSVVSPLKILKRANPRYPRRAVNRGAEGYCRVKFDVTAEGEVINPAAIPEQCSPRGFFEEAAVEAIRKFQYSPRYIDDTPVATLGEEFRFIFRLAD